MLDALPEVGEVDFLNIALCSVAEDAPVMASRLVAADRSRSFHSAAENGEPDWPPDWWWWVERSTAVSDRSWPVEIGDSFDARAPVGLSITGWSKSR